MHKLLSFQILIQPIDDCDAPCLNEAERLETMNQALISLRDKIKPLMLSGYQILGYGPVPEKPIDDKPYVN